MVPETKALTLNSEAFLYFSLYFHLRKRGKMHITLLLRVKFSDLNPAFLYLLPEDRPLQTLP